MRRPRGWPAVLFPRVRCVDFRPHGHHSWRSPSWWAPLSYWCRGRAPETVGEAFGGMQDLSTFAEACAYAQVCKQSVAGRRFLLTGTWHRRSLEIAAAHPNPWRPQ